MAGFKDQLNKELERRKLKNSPETLDAIQSADQPPQNQQKISIRTFSLGIFFAFTISTALIFWAFVNAADTQEKIDNKLISKTVLIDKPIIEEAQIIEEREVAPVVAIPPSSESPISEQPIVLEPVESVEAPTNSSTSLVAAPIPGLYESSDFGLLPQIRAKDGLTSFNAYKRPFTIRADQPLLSFVITNTGLSKSKIYSLIENLPPEITFAFSPYATDLKQIIDQARAGGHESWLSLPLETQEYPRKDPGPLTLLKSVSEQQNQDRFNKILSSANGYVGFVTNKDHAFDAEATKTSPVLNQVFTRGLTIFDTSLSSPHFNKILASKYDAPYGIADIWLDDDLTPIGLNRQIRKMIELGKAKGKLVVMLNDYPTSINTLEKFLSSAAAKDFQLAPLSAQVQYVD